jgi:hypothetical protein
MAIQVEQVPKSISEMVGEICRELAVLVLVFVPLELFKDTQISGYVIAAAIIGSIVLAALGILIEWLREYGELLHCPLGHPRLRLSHRHRWAGLRGS